jgi:hypothetical protein
MAIWVGIFLNNLDGTSVRELEVEADNEVTAVMLLDLYDYDETWQDYSFVEVRAMAVRQSRPQKDLKQPVCVSLVHAYIKAFVTTLVCVPYFSCLCLYKLPLYYGQSPKFHRSGFQVCCKEWTPSTHQKNTRIQALLWMAIAQ